MPLFGRGQNSIFLYIPISLSLSLSLSLSISARALRTEEPISSARKNQLAFMDKTWLKSDRRTKKYQDGVVFFLDYAFAHGVVTEENEISCPCVKCLNTKYADRETVEGHLVWNGMMRNYGTWFRHGEDLPRNGRMHTLVEAINEQVLKDDDDGEVDNPPSRSDFFAQAMRPEQGGRIRLIPHVKPEHLFPRQSSTTTKNLEQELANAKQKNVELKDEHVELKDKLSNLISDVSSLKAQAAELTEFMNRMRSQGVGSSSQG